MRPAPAERTPAAPPAPAQPQPSSTSIVSYISLAASSDNLFSLFSVFSVSPTSVVMRTRLPLWRPLDRSKNTVSNGDAEKCRSVSRSRDGWQAHDAKTRDTQQAPFSIWKGGLRE